MLKKSIDSGYVEAFLALLLWGGTAVANKVAVLNSSPTTIVLYRIAIASLLAIVLLKTLNIKIPTNKSERVHLVLSGGASFIVWPLLLSIGIKYSTASEAAAIMASIPVITVLLAELLKKRIPRITWWIGAVIAVTCTVYISTINIKGTIAFNMKGNIIIFLGCVVCAIGYLCGSKLAEKHGALSTTLLGLSISLFFALPVLGIHTAINGIVILTMDELIGVVWMGVFSSVIGYVLWYGALAKGGAERIGTLQLGQPFVTFFIAAFVLKEIISLELIIACMFLVLGTFISSRGVTKQ